LNDLHHSRVIRRCISGELPGLFSYRQLPSSFVDDLFAVRP
jgi:hypothetical protein